MGVSGISVCGLISFKILVEASLEFRDKTPELRPPFS